MRVAFGTISPNELIIEILPAFYQTWWAKLIYVFIVIGLIYLAYHVLSNRMKVANALKIQEMEHAKIDELNQSKLKFFTNISHELLTPLTVLSCAVDQLRKTYPDKDDTFETMKRNINRLMRLLQQILEFRKAETGNLKLKVSYGDVAQFIISLCNDHFKPLSDSKQIDLQVESFPESFMDGLIRTNSIRSFIISCPTPLNIILRAGAFSHYSGSDKEGGERV